MTIEYCDTCGKMLILEKDKENHTCPPKKLYRIPCYHGEEWQEGYARDPKFLAEEVAEDYWSDDPCDPHDFEVEVEIKTDDGIDTYTVTAEPRVDFYAEKK